MRLLDVTDVRRVLDEALAFDAASDSARLRSEGGVTVARAGLGVDRAWLRVLAGAVPELDLLGYKAFGGNRGGEVTFHCYLYRLSTGEPMGLIDARAITAMRTAAHAVLAVHHVFGDDPIVVAMIGSGGEARQGLRMLASKCNVREARVFSPRVTSREKFARELGQELKIPIAAVDGVAAACKGADLAYSATTSGGTVVIESHDIVSLPMLATLGSTAPHQREVEGSVFHDVERLIVDTPDVFDASGDLLAAVQGCGEIPASRICLLGDMLREQRTGLAERRLIYKSIGSAEQDLVLAYRVLERAVEMGAGESIDALYPQE